MRTEYTVSYKAKFDGGWSQLTIPASDIPAAKAFVATHSAPIDLSRADYEARCNAAGVEPIPDSWISRKAYSIRNGDFSVLSYTAQHVVSMHLAKMRLYGIKAEQAKNVQPTPVSPAPETFVCPGCHRTFPRSAAMNASTAMTCPDCYDDFS